MNNYLLDKNLKKRIEQCFDRFFDTLEDRGEYKFPFKLSLWIYQRPISIENDNVFHFKLAVQRRWPKERGVFMADEYYPHELSVVLLKDVLENKNTEYATLVIVSVIKQIINPAIAYFDTLKRITNLGE